MKFWKKHKNDLLLICALLLLAGGIWVYMCATRTQGGEAVVTVDGAELMRLPLQKDTLLPVPQAEGNANSVEVLGGAVRVVEANCPDHVCERQGWIRYDGETVVCLPHRLIVTVVGGEAVTDATSQ